MNVRTMEICEKFITDRDVIKREFGWDSALIQLACASIYLDKKESANAKKLDDCKKILKENVGFFSNFKGTAKPVIVATIAAEEQPEQLLKQALALYDLLKEEKFASSNYLPFTAMILAKHATKDTYEQLAKRTREIYKRMKAEHPILTSEEDTAFCALMALSEKSDDVLMQEAESCYRMLKSERRLSSNVVQSLSHVLALCDGNPEEKCNRTIELYDRLRQEGLKYGTDYELPTLGVLAMCGASFDQIASDMKEIDAWLAEQKGFGMLSGISKKQRLMYAGMIAEQEYIKKDMMQTAAVSGVISIIVAQEAAMCAAIAASSAAAAANASNS